MISNFLSREIWGHSTTFPHFFNTSESKIHFKATRCKISVDSCKETLYQETAALDTKCRIQRNHLFVALKREVLCGDCPLGFGYSPSGRSTAHTG